MTQKCYNGEVKSPKKSTPWLALAFVIVGIIIGYGAVVFEHRDTAFAGAYRCPAHKEECANGDCSHDTLCAQGGCSKGCPGNCHKQA